MRTGRQTRREFVRTVTTAAPAALLAGAAKAQAPAKLPQRTLGKTGVTVPIIGLGTVSIGHLTDRKEAERLLNKAIDLGVTYIDTAPPKTRIAPLTGYVAAHRYLNGVLKELRKEVFLVTKCLENDGSKTLDLLKRWEGCVLHAYDDADPARPPRFIQPGDPVRGTLTIGYGHTRTARPGQRISPADAERLLLEDLAPVEAAIARSITVPLTDGQHGALVSFAFNLGHSTAAGKPLTNIAATLNRGDYDGALRRNRSWRRLRRRCLRRRTSRDHRAHQGTAEKTRCNERTNH